MSQMRARLCEIVALLRTLDTGKGSHDPETPGLGKRLMAAYKIND
ncbi:hypothetical protein [Streptococcus hyointestinalis]